MFRLRHMFTDVAKENKHIKSNPQNTLKGRHHICGMQFDVTHIYEVRKETFFFISLLF